MSYENPFLKSAEMLFFGDGAATPAWTFVPFTMLKAKEVPVEDEWNSAEDVDDTTGVSWGDGQVTGMGLTMDYEAILKDDGAATPAVKAGLKLILDCQFTVGADRRKQFLWKRADGTWYTGYADVVPVEVMGDINKVARITATIKSRGKVTTYEGTKPTRPA